MNDEELEMALLTAADASAQLTLWLSQVPESQLQEIIDTGDFDGEGLAAFELAKRRGSEGESS